MFFSIYIFLDSPRLIPVKAARANPSLSDALNDDYISDYLASYFGSM